MKEGHSRFILQSSIYTAESMNKDGLFPSSTTNVTEEGKEESGG